jgi:hypothetical protein
MDSDGDLVIPMGLAHEALQPEITNKAVPNMGTATYTFIQKDRKFEIVQNLSLLQSASQGDAYASRQLDFASMLYEKLSPQYAWIDTFGGHRPSKQHILRSELQYIFWANFFGPRIVTEIGRDILRGAPAHLGRDLADGGFLCVVTKSYQEWTHTPQRSVLEYFRQTNPRIELFGRTSIE